MSDTNAQSVTSMLEARLRRVEYAVCGHVPEVLSSSTSGTITQRLQDLNRAFDDVLASSPLALELFSLFSHHPELFKAALDSDLATPDEATARQAIVLAAAVSYQQTASALTSILDMPISSAEQSVRIIQTKTNLAKLELLQRSQSKEVLELRQRSADVLKKWYEVNILANGEWWSQTEKRLQAAEGQIRRHEKSKLRAEQGVI